MDESNDQGRDWGGEKIWASSTARLQFETIKKIDVGVDGKGEPRKTAEREIRMTI